MESQNMKLPILSKRWAFVQLHILQNEPLWKMLLNFLLLALQVN